MDSYAKQQPSESAAPRTVLVDDLEEFIPVGDDEPVVAVEDPASPEADEGPSTSGQEALPWAKPSGRIAAPLLRLHNGRSCQLQGPC